MDYKPFVNHTSKLYPDVTFVLKKMTKALRVRYDMDTTKPLASLRALTQEREALDPEVLPIKEKAKNSTCTCTHEQFVHDHEWFYCTVEGCSCRRPDFPKELAGKFQDITKRELGVVENEMYPALMRWGLYKVSGVDLFDLDGNPVPFSVDNLLSFAPEDLCNEIAGTIHQALMLGDTEIKNSVSPTTSPVQEGGATPSITVPVVEKRDSIIPEIAAVSPI